MASSSQRGRKDLGEASWMASARGRAEPSSAGRKPGAPVEPGALKSLRTDYRDLKTAISAERDVLVRDSDRFDAVVNRVNRLYAGVERPREQRADLEAITDLSSLLLESTKNLQRKTGPTPTDFVNALCRKFVNRRTRIDWAKFGVHASRILCEAPGLSTMLGPMDIQPKPRKARIVRSRQRPGPMTRPEELIATGAKNDSGETDKNIETLFKILRTHKQVRFEALVLNRRSFAQTVENIFALSFLVKDGRVSMTRDEEGHFQLVPKNAPSASERLNGIVNSQFVLRLDYADWLFMKEQLEEGAELVPDRPPSIPASAPSFPASVTPIRKTSRNRARETGSISQAMGDDEDGPRPKKILSLG